MSIGNAAGRKSMYVSRRIKNIGFVSTRFQGTDGVTLETEKWVEVLETIRYDCYFFAGQSDWTPTRTMVVPEASFEHPDIKTMHQQFFGVKVRPNALTGKVHEYRQLLKTHLYSFIEKFKIDLFIIENALSIPTNIPLGLAITEVVAETGLPTVAHHHDFFWEQERFMVHGVGDFLNTAFPPSLDSITHVVINSQARKMLSFRCGLSSVIIPNVFNYDSIPPEIDDYNCDVREALGLTRDDLMFLQPTHIAQRNGIETAIETVHRLNDPRIKLVIAHSGKEEGEGYYNRVKAYAALMNVPLVIKAEIVNTHRSTTEEGQKQYTLWDIFLHADFITYPSTYEGFGNAFLEAVYFKKPILVNRYSIYQQEIEPIGFDVVEMNSFITEAELDEIRLILSDPKRRQKMVDKNYELAERYFSYEVLQQKLREILLNYGQV
jgi:glycosyltransferase involved in cell wall biosynthesis